MSCAPAIRRTWARWGAALVELAADQEFFTPLLEQIPAGSPGVHWLVQPGRGPRLVLVHRPDGVMAYTHSHRCWVAIAPVRGVETQREEYDPEQGTWQRLSPGDPGRSNR